MFEKVTKIALAGIIGIGTLLGSSALVSAEVVKEYDSEAKVEFEENTEETDPVDPTDPIDPVDPTDSPIDQGDLDGTKGPLSIDYASHFDFGKLPISGNKIVLNAEPVGITSKNKDGAVEKFVSPYVQVTDNRGTNAGWSLEVKQDGKLTNGESELEKAEISFTKKGVVKSVHDESPEVQGSGEMVLTNESQPVLGAPDPTLGGTYTNSFGPVNEKGNDTNIEKEEVGVQLSIPAGTAIETGEYKTKIKWTLTDTPLK